MDNLLLFFHDNSTVSVICGSLIILFVCILIDYLLLTSHWSSKNIPGPRGIPLIGVAHRFSRFSSPQLFADGIRKYGKIYGTYEGRTKCLVISDCDLIKDVLIKNFNKFASRRVPFGHWIPDNQLLNQVGNEWRMSRALMSPAFTSSKMKLMYPKMQECYSFLDRELQTIACEGGEVAVKDLFGKLTTSVIAACAFATKVDTFREHDNPLVSSLLDWLTPRPLLNLVSLILPLSLKQMIQFTTVRSSTIDYLIRTCEQIQRQRKSTSVRTGDYNDLLQLLIDAGSEKDENSNKDQSSAFVVDNEWHHMLVEEEKKQVVVEKDKKRLSQQEVIANTILFFLAGYETTATTLTFATYLLATHPHIQDRLHREIEKSVSPEDLADLQYEELTSFKYLDAFISEALRLYPGVPRLQRVTLEDHTFSNGLRVERGTVIQIPIYNVHHDEEYFEDADSCNPDRFLPENRGRIRAGSYLPFAIGPKNCIAMRFALMELKITLTNLVSKYEIVACDKTQQLKTHFKPGSFLRPIEEVVVKILPRQSTEGQ